MFSPLDQCVVVYCVGICLLAESTPAGFSPQVAALVAALDKDFAADRKKIAELDLSPVLAASYVSMVEAELKRRGRGHVAVELHTLSMQRLFEDVLPGWQTHL